MSWQALRVMMKQSRTQPLPWRCVYYLTRRDGNVPMDPGEWQVDSFLLIKNLGGAAVATNCFSASKTHLRSTASSCAFVSQNTAAFWNCIHCIFLHIGLSTILWLYHVSQRRSEVLFVFWHWLSIAGLLRMDGATLLCFHPSSPSAHMRHLPEIHGAMDCSGDARLPSVWVSFQQCNSRGFFSFSPTFLVEKIVIFFL